MFDAQSLLGGLLKEVISGGKSGSNSSSSKAALGMGALGVAIAAFEHFTQEQNTSAQSTANNSRPPPPAGQKPVLSQQDGAVAPSAPPPPPPMSKHISTPSAPPPIPSNALSEGRQVFQETALLLIDAMLAAANADGYIDPDEKAKIIEQLKQINSDQEGFDYVQQRIDNPPALAQICRSTSDPEIAKQIYMVSLLAITVDTAEEADYLQNLASCLAVDADTVKQLNKQFQTKE